MFSRRFVGQFMVLAAVAFLAGTASAANPTGSCSNCGNWPWNDSCSWSGSASINSGYSYYIVVECEKTCNGPGQCNTKKCDVSYSARKDKTYKLGGSLTFDQFGFTAGWESTTSDNVGCNYSDECSQPSCCVGPAYSYVKYTYDERGQWMYDSSKSYYCTPCQARTGVGETYSNPVCGGNKHNQYEPALIGSTGACTWAGIP